MKLALVTDVFPPNSGGSGWSTFYLGRALQQRGHEVQIVMPREHKEPGTTVRDYEGLPVTEYHYQAAKLPFVRNYTRNERLYPAFAEFLKGFFKEHATELVHGQHYLTIPPSVQAARQLGIPSVGTVRDYWPVCYWTTHLSGDKVCPGCSEINRLVCLYRNQGPIGIPAAPVSLYMASNLKLKQKWLAQADRTLAVSGYIADKLRPHVPAEKLEVLPNFIDLARLEQIVAEPPATPGTDQPYLLFVGKFEENKGARLLLDVLRHARPALPTLAVGDGSLRSEMEAAAREGLNLRVLDWAKNEEVLRLMKHAEALLFPSLWPEPLSRVLLEAMGVGALVVAMETGGTTDIIQHNVNGLLANDATGMARQLAEILAPGQTETRTRLKAAARATAQTKFSQEAVVGRVEKLYLKLAGQA